MTVDETTWAYLRARFGTSSGPFRIDLQWAVNVNIHRDKSKRYSYKKQCNPIYKKWLMKN